MFWKSTYNELIKIASKPRSYIGFGAITLLVGIIIFAMKADGMSFISFAIKPFEQSLSFEGNIINGNLVTYLILQTLIIHVPLLIAFVTGDLVSGEGALGTIRLLLSKPISRSKVLLSKYIAGITYTFFIVLWLGFLSLGIGKMIFGSGDMIVLGSSGLIIFPENDIAWRFALAFGVAFLSMAMITTLSLTLSCFSDNSIGPIVSTMAIIIVLTIVGNLDISVLQHLQPYLFTSHMLAWRNFFEDPLPFKEIINSATVLSAHIIVLLFIAFYKFNKKDILS